jgi:ribonuclease Z
MLEVVFLGTGCGIPTKYRSHPAIWVRYEGDHMLFDCGEGTQRQMITAKLSFMKVDRIFITHWHADHWAGLIGIMQSMNLEGRKNPLYIYGPDAERFVSDILDLDYWGPNFDVRPKSIPFEGSEITGVFKNKDFEITSIPTKHTVPSVAYCFREKDRMNVDIKKAEKLYGLRQGRAVGQLKEKGSVVFKGKKITLEDVGILKKGMKLVYTGDTEYTENIVKISKDAGLLIHDATFIEKMENRMHSGATEAAQIAKKAGVKKLVLTHFSRRYTDIKEIEDAAKKIFPDSICAKDFMRIVLR